MAHTNVQLVSGNLTTGQASPTFFIDRVNDKIGIGGVPDITGVEADPATSNVLQVTGNMLATRYHGDGSTLTGIESSKWALTNDGINRVGNVGIGGLASATAATKLYVHGDILATGDVTASSDRRLKTDIKRIENALDKVCSLGGYTYVMNDKPSSGLIAQEVLEVLPEVVHGSEETNYSLAYGNIVGLLVEAIKELKEKIG
jgi:hypothetical protein|tara:strand:+ start:434 stop:1039 length:606 start_codon:yes stop_codon:yes gene_type:complete